MEETSQYIYSLNVGKHTLEQTVDLVERAQNKDAHAFSILYEAISVDLYRCALFILHNPQDAEDAVSETVLAAFRTISSLRNAESFRPWIFRILSNQCKRVIRSPQRKLVPFENDEESYDFPDIEDSCDIRNALTKLSEEERRIVSLSVFSGYNSTEVASMMDLNANTVRSKLSRALAKLKQYVSG